MLPGWAFHTRLPMPCTRISVWLITRNAIYLPPISAGRPASAAVVNAFLSGSPFAGYPLSGLLYRRLAGLIPAFAVALTYWLCCTCCGWAGNVSALALRGLNHPAALLGALGFEACLSCLPTMAPSPDPAVRRALDTLASVGLQPPRARQEGSQAWGGLLSWEAPILALISGRRALERVCSPALVGLALLAISGSPGQALIGRIYCEEFRFDPPSRQ